MNGKEQVQYLGRFLSGMVMPNIGAFIAWGLLSALFLETGWLPDERLAALSEPMALLLLPVLIAYTGGGMVYGRRGAVIGAVAVMGVVAGAGTPMFLGAMATGPLAAWVLKKVDALCEKAARPGFEMLLNNFSMGITGAALAAAAMFGIRPLADMLSQWVSSGVGFFIERGFLPLASILIEPAKVLFLNNAVNHGILSPLGIQQAEEAVQGLKSAAGFIRREIGHRLRLRHVPQMHFTATDSIEYSANISRILKDWNEGKEEDDAHHAAAGGGTPEKR